MGRPTSFPTENQLPAYKPGRSTPDEMLRTAHLAWTDLKRAATADDVRSAFQRYSLVLKPQMLAALLLHATPEEAIGVR